MIATLFSAVAAFATLLPGVTAPGLPPPKDRAAAQTEEFVPRWDGNDIVAGSKRLSVRIEPRSDGIDIVVERGSTVCAKGASLACGTRGSVL